MAQHEATPQQGTKTGGADPNPPHRPGRSATRRRARWAALLLLASACGDSATEPSGNVVGGVDLDLLFAPPSTLERQAIEGDWELRAPSAVAVQVERRETFQTGGASAEIQVLSHEVDGHRHFGAVLGPAGGPPGSVPVLVYAHGGDAGVSVDEVVLAAAALGLAPHDFVIVAPSFRSEPLRWGNDLWVSEGEASPWDRDVDDALALVEAVVETVPAADPGRVGILGLSRGGAVGLLMAIRDPRIAAVVSYFAPTDFLGPFVKEVVRDVLLGRPPDLPGVAVLGERFIVPLQAGELTLDEVRLELLRRSPAHFAGRLPAVQLHHGTADEVVPVEEAHHLEAAMADLGRGPPAFEVHIYQGAGHTPLAMPLSVPRVREFLRVFVVEAAVPGTLAP